MPAMANLTLNSKVYIPRGASDGVAKWILVGDATFGGAPSQVSESVRGPLSDGTYRTRWLVDVPKVASVDSACACIGSNIGKGRADMTFVVPTSFTTAEKQDFVDRVQALIALAVFDVSVGSSEGSW
jgi:hypothetical protein